MKKYKNMMSVLVTCLLLFSSFLLDNHIVGITESYTALVLSGLFFLFLIPSILLFQYSKIITSLLTEQDFAFIKLLKIPFFSILMYSFIGRFIPDFHSHPVIVSLIFVLEYAFCILVSYYFVKKVLVIFNQRQS
ncbi:hypothetical protein [Escherichia coli]